MMRTMALALALALVSFSVAGPVRAQAAPSDAVVRGWFERSAGTTSFPIGKVEVEGHPPVSGTVEHVDRCSAILILTGINVQHPRTAQQLHFPLLWAQVKAVEQGPRGLVLVQSDYGAQPVLDLPIDQATVTGLRQIIQECRTPAAMMATYDAFVVLLEDALTEAAGLDPDVTLRQDGPCQLALSGGSQSHDLLWGGDLVSADDSGLTIRRLSDDLQTHFAVGPERAHRAAELIGALKTQCAWMADLSA